MSTATLIFLKCGNVEYIITEHGTHELPCSNEFGPLGEIHLDNAAYVELGVVGPVKVRWTRILTNASVANSFRNYLEPHYQINSVEYVRKMILEGRVVAPNLIGALWFYNERRELHNWSCGKYLTMIDHAFKFIASQTWLEICMWGLIMCFSSKRPPAIRPKPVPRRLDEVAAGIYIEDVVIRD
jgi:hypothetical protein